MQLCSSVFSAFAVNMVYYVDEKTNNFSELSECWKGRKLPGKLRFYIYWIMQVYSKPTTISVSNITRMYTLQSNHYVTLNIYPSWLNISLLESTYSCSVLLPNILNPIMLDRLLYLWNTKCMQIVSLFVNRSRM